jgi:poly-gamma-glutamate capsule biosynthesis protein CapA/YwtB (metallophosphatase superfamily)
MIRLIFLVCCIFTCTIIRAQDTTRLSLLFIGDVMQHDSQLQSAYNPTTKAYEYASCFQFVKPYFESVDIAIGNLEVTLAGPPYKGYPQFSAPDALAQALKEAGLDVLVTANNHSVDRGRKGLERTIALLDSLQITHTGTFSDTVERMNDYPLIIKKNGIAIALLNYTYGTNGIRVTKPNIVNLLDTAIIRKDMMKARELNPDFIIVFTHWGLEYQSQPSNEQKGLAEFCLQLGANVVMGSHPHVLQPMEWREDKNQLVVYSLGNFISGQRDRYKNGGGMVRVELSKIIMDSVATSKIDSVGYILEWVYRTADSQRNFFVLPVPDFENDTTGFIKDDNSKLSFKTFMDDSRKLFKKYNLNAEEIKEQPAKRPDE